MLLDEEHDSYGEFSEGERRELIFRLFLHLVYGGPLNQVTYPQSSCCWEAGGVSCWLEQGTLQTCIGCGLTIL